MAIAYVQKKHVYPGASATFDNPVVAGNLIVVSLHWANSASPANPTDSQLNTYAKAVERFNADSTRCAIYYAYNVSGGSGFQVDWSGTPTDIGGSIYEYSGVLASADPLRTTATSLGEADTQLPISQPFVPTAGDLIFAAFGDETAVAGPIGQGAGYTIRELDLTHIEAQEDWVPALGGSQPARYNVGIPGVGNDNWVIAVAVFAPIPERRWILIHP